MARIPLTIFRLTDQVDGNPTDHLAVLREAIDNQEIPAGVNAPQDSRLFVKGNPLKDATWREWLCTYFPTIPEQATSLPGALLVLKVERNTQPCWFAISFGSGHHLLREDVIVRRWGLKTVLNLLYNPDQPIEKIRRVDAKTLSSNRMIVARQLSRLDSIDQFGINIRQDLMGAVAGAPCEKKKWGNIIGGRDSLHISVEANHLNISDLCQELLTIFESNRYQERFRWIDHIVPIQDPALKSRLMTMLLEKIKSGDVNELELCPPDLISWDGVTFAYVGVGRERVDSLLMSDYIHFLQSSNTQAGQSNKLADLDERMISKNHKIEALQNEAVLGTWSLLRCIDAEFMIDAQRYILSNGDFYSVSNTFRDEIFGILQNSIQLTNTLPANVEGRIESEYIIQVCSNDDNSILMDRKLEQAQDMPTEIEICDIYQRGRRFVHLKRKTKSSTLSHLFNQALVSSLLLVRHPEFRQKSFDRIRQEETAKFADDVDGHVTFVQNELNAGNFSARDSTICIGILSRWENAEDWIDRIPFFSLVTLSRVIEDLKALSYSVEFEAIFSPGD